MITRDLLFFSWTKPLMFHYSNDIKYQVGQSSDNGSTWTKIYTANEEQFTLKTPTYFLTKSDFDNYQWRVKFRSIHSC